MPKRKNGSPPVLKRDGVYAVVYLNGKRIRLGRYGTEEANKEYRRIVGEWLALGDVVAANETETSLIDELALAFLRQVKTIYGPSDYGAPRKIAFPNSTSTEKAVLMKIVSVEI